MSFVLVAANSYTLLTLITHGGGISDWTLVSLDTCVTGLFIESVVC